MLFNFYLFKIQIFSKNANNCRKSAENTLKLKEIWLKMKKIDFSFFVLHFSPKNEKLKKSEKRNFFVSVQPIVYILKALPVSSASGVAGVT